VRFEPRQAVLYLAIAAVAGAFLLLPAVGVIGQLMLPFDPPPPMAHAPELIGQAIWAKFLGGRATELQPINPFTLARMLSCHALAERYDAGEREAQHVECMKLMPAVQGVAYLSTINMRSHGVWQDPRVPFVQIATMSRLSTMWKKSELIDALAERGEFVSGVKGVDQAARVFFGRRAEELTVPQAALIAALLGSMRIDPWCVPERVAKARRDVLDQMRDNGAIDDAALEAANIAELGLSAPPANHKECGGQQ
jgi:hypothetical protein